MYVNLKDLFKHSYKFTVIIPGKILISETVEGKNNPFTSPTLPSKTQQTLTLPINPFFPQKLKNHQS